MDIVVRDYLYVLTILEHVAERKDAMYATRDDELNRLLP